MTQNKEELLSKIKQTVHSVEPTATVILYGSFARGEDTVDSDIDILILLNKVYLSYHDKKQVKYPLYDIEFETGQIISPLVLSRQDWEIKHRITPFYENVIKEGIVL
jgi:predicted nucleotidyltransferase